MAKEVLLNDINLQLTKELTVTHDTVKVTVNIAVQIDENSSEVETKKLIKDSLKKFIGTEWNLGQIHRFNDDTGHETLTLSASSRVSENQNYRLIERAREISRPGFQITNPTVDYSIPTKLIEETNEKLRKALAEEAYNQAAVYTNILHPTEFGSKYIVASLIFVDKQANNMSNVRGYTASTTPIMIGSGAEDNLETSTKFTMSANVILRSHIKI